MRVAARRRRACGSRSATAPPASRRRRSRSPTRRTGAACTLCSAWPTPGASRCGATGRARRCGSRCPCPPTVPTTTAGAPSRRRSPPASRWRACDAAEQRQRRPRRQPATAARAADARRRAGRGPSQGVRVVLDGLRDAVVATDDGGTIRYVNKAAEELLGWPRGPLVGRPGLRPRARFADGGRRRRLRRPSCAPRPSNLVGRPLDVDIRRADGTEVRTELVISIFDHPLAGPWSSGIIRPRDETKLQRWSELTSELLEILADAPIDEPPAERLLSTLGRRLDWDVTTLWALSADQELVCRHVWTRTPEHRPRLRAGEGGRSDQRERGPSRAGSSSTASRCGWPTSSADQRFVTDALVRGRAAERLRLPGPLPRRVRRDRQDAEPSPARTRPVRRRAHGRGRRPPRRAAARVGAGDRARAAGRGAPRGPAAQRVPAAGHPGALRGRRLPRDGGAPGPGLGPGHGRPLPHRHRGRGRPACGGWPPGTPTRTSGRSPRSCAPRTRPTPGSAHPTMEVMRSGRLHVERRHGRRVPAVAPAGTSGTTPF